MSLFFNKKKKEENTANIILSPLTGNLQDISECSDPVFAQELVGKGLMIIPSEGSLYSPVDGRISLVADSNHAVGITANSGAEILIHIGLDTVELEGKGFKTHVNKEDQVRAGDLLLEFDIDEIKKAGKSTESPVIITNPDNFEIIKVNQDQVFHGDKLMEIEAK